MKDSNNCIMCHVKECRHNNNKKGYCTLERIEIRKNKSIADTMEATDCANFRGK